MEAHCLDLVAHNVDVQDGPDQQQLLAAPLPHYGLMLPGLPTSSQLAPWMSFDAHQAPPSASGWPSSKVSDFTHPAEPDAARSRCSSKLAGAHCRMCVLMLHFH